MICCFIAASRRSVGTGPGPWTGTADRQPTARIGEQAARMKRNFHVFRIAILLASRSHAMGRRARADRRSGLERLRTSPPGVERRRESEDEPSEELGAGAAGQDLGAVPQLDQEAPRVEGAEALDRLEAHDVRAMDLAEQLGVQT